MKAYLLDLVRASIAADLQLLQRDELKEGYMMKEEVC